MPFRHALTGDDILCVGFDGPHGVSFDAVDLHIAQDRISGNHPVASQENDQGWDYPGGAASGGGDHPMSGGVLFRGGKGIGAQINKEELRVPGHTPGALVKEGGLAVKADRSWKIALRRQTPLHGGEDPFQTVVDFLFRPTGYSPFVGHHDFEEIQTAPFEKFRQLASVFIWISGHTPD